jgi:hypothetical protein
MSDINRYERIGDALVEGRKRAQAPQAPQDEWATHEMNRADWIAVVASAALLVIVFIVVTYGLMWLTAMQTQVTP